MSPSWTLLSPQACLDLARQILLRDTKKSARTTTPETEPTPASGTRRTSATLRWNALSAESSLTRNTATNADGRNAEMAYDNLITDFPAEDLVPGDTFVSGDWQYAYVVVDPVKLGFTPVPGTIYCWSLVEAQSSLLSPGMTVKKVKLYHYSFQD